MAKTLEKVIAEAHERVLGICSSESSELDGYFPSLDWL